MTVEGRPVLVVPGWTNSGPGHWQTLWERAHPETFRRVEQRDWGAPERDEWVAALDAAVRASVRVATAPPVLVAHSVGCITVAHWAASATDGAASAAAALLVAPADVERPGGEPALRSFAPIPLAPLPFPSVVVASRNDPYLRFARAAAFAEAWGSGLVDAGEAGHVNTASGHGEWQEGERLLAELMARIDGR